ncbi:MAG: hypothetical protein HUU21_22205 [Polyangiaceae bacterium]|nr:hypothetical protein [Polyangiaceae bacterium]
MTDISTQFHATPKELMVLVSAFTHEHTVYITAIRFSPFEARQVNELEVEPVFLDNSVERIVLTIRPPVLPANSMNHFLDRNIDALILDIGRLNNAGLKESWLTARTNDKEALNTWRKLVKKLRAMTRAGAVAVDPKTGATTKLRAHRFSDGAKDLEVVGVPMLPVAGSARLRFED